MSELTWKDKLREFVSSIFWRGFLWTNGYTEESYSDAKWVDEVLWRIHKGKFDHSIYQHCRSCHSWGVPKMDEYRKVCGNCGNKTDTTIYFPIDFL